MWSKTWIMRLNAMKCQAPPESNKKHSPLQTRDFIDNNVLEEVQHHPYLGVELTCTPNLSWKTHITNISGKANRILNLPRRHVYGCSQEVHSMALTTLVRHHLEYCSTVTKKKTGSGGDSTLGCPFCDWKLIIPTECYCYLYA